MSDLLFPIIRKTFFIKQPTQWATKNDIEINLAKTQIMTIRGNKFLYYNNLPRTSEIKILGVYLKQTLRRKKHFQYITKKIASKLHLLRKLKSIYPKKIFYCVITLILILF